MNWAHYIIQVNIYLVVFYGFYKLLLDKETYFTLNRIYLIAAGALSLAIPFLRFEWFATQPVAQPVYISVGQLNQLVTQIVVRETPDAFTMSTLLVVLYFLGVLFFVLRLVYQLYTVRRLISKNGKGSAFSFLTRQFVDDQLPGSQTISKHEEIHTRQLHTADVLFFEILGTLTWFNPIIYFYKSTIKNIHEYLADEEAAHFQGNKDQYAMLLMSNALGVQPSTLINGFFNKSLLKKRIYMLYKQRSRKVAVLKYGLFVPLFALTLVASSATIRNNEKIKEIADEIPLNQPVVTVANLIEEVTSKPALAATISIKAADWSKFYGHVQKYIRYPASARDAKLTGGTQVKFGIKSGEVTGVNVAGASLGSGCDTEVMRVILSYQGYSGLPDGKYVLRVIFTLDGVSGPMKNSVPVAVPGYTKLNDVVIRGYLAAPAPDLSKLKADESGKVYDFVSVEGQPSFPGGMDQFFKYIGKAVRYPKEAQEKNIQGKVFLSFVVETDGTLTDIKIQKGVSNEIDEEAIRVIKASPKWIPAVKDKQKVRVQYNIPISFSLSDESSPKKADVEKLQGKVPGIRIDGAVRIGEPLVGPTSPLYIIDGVKLKKAGVNEKVSPLSTIPQNDIASIEVFKDSTATALYGDEGKYGVIKITTINKDKAKPAKLKEVTIQPPAKPTNKTN
jgi:TonB family protein